MPLVQVTRQQKSLGFHPVLLKTADFRGLHSASSTGHEHLVELLTPQVEQIDGAELETLSIKQMPQK